MGRMGGWGGSLLGISGLLTSTSPDDSLLHLREGYEALRPASSAGSVPGVLQSSSTGGREEPQLRAERSA
jgi:hypothetical protein